MTAESIPDVLEPGALPAYSVLIPVYQRETVGNLDASLRSLAGQTVQAAQIVIVEDGPIPAALHEALRQWEGALPIHRLRLAEHRGIGPALNAGLEACRNEFVGRMDADDIAVQGRFALQLGRINREPSIDVLGGQIEEFGGARTNRLRVVPLGHAAIRARALYRNPMNHMTVLYRRSAILRVGGYRDVPAMEDYDLWIRALGAGLQFENLAEVVVRARTGAGFLERRRGLAYARHEWAFGMRKEQTGVWPRWKVRLVTIMRALVRLLPDKAMEFAYGVLLRKAP